MYLFENFILLFFCGYSLLIKTTSIRFLRKQFTLKIFEKKYFNERAAIIIEKASTIFLKFKKEPLFGEDHLSLLEKIRKTITLKRILIDIPKITMSIRKQSNKETCMAQQSNNYSMMRRKVLSLVLASILFQQIILTQAADISSNAIENGPRKAELDCYRLKFILKSLFLRIRQLEMYSLHASKVPFELAEIESWCGGNDFNVASELIKRNFDEIDRSGFRGFTKRNFDEIDKSGFRGFMGRK